MLEPHRKAIVAGFFGWPGTGRITGRMKTRFVIFPECA
jgi:hypothetical protein